MLLSKKLERCFVRFIIGKYLRKAGFARVDRKLALSIFQMKPYQSSPKESYQKNVQKR